MLAKGDTFAGQYYCGPYEPPGESEGSGSSGRIDAEITASEGSSAPKRKCSSLNPDKNDTLGVSMQVLSLSKMSESERKGLIHRLKHELEQIRMFQKKVELQRTNGVTVSSSSNILSCSNGQVLPHAQDFQKSMASGSRKKGNPLSGKARGLKRPFPGTSELAKHASAVNTSNIMLMKQCEGLLKRLMGHQYGWVFNQPVDIVKLNIPDYFNVIKHPMDLGTVKKKIASGAYGIPLEFHDDVKLTFSNAMTYNPPGNDVHIMADTLNKFFEVRWKNIDKKLPVIGSQFVQSKAPSEDLETSKSAPPAKKRKTTSVAQEIVKEPAKRMTDEEKHDIGRQLESLLSEMPTHIIDFLREHRSNGNEYGEEEIEIDIDVMNESAPSNSSMQQGKGNDQAYEDVDIGEMSLPIKLSTSELPTNQHMSLLVACAEIWLDSDSGSSDSESDGAKASSLVDAVKVPDTMDSGAQLDEKTGADNLLVKNQCLSGLDQLEQTSRPKPSSVESDGCQDGRCGGPGKIASGKRGTGTTKEERFELSVFVRRHDCKQKPRLQKMLEDELKQKLQQRRDGRGSLSERSTAGIAEEMLSTTPVENLPSSVDGACSDHNLEALGSFKFGGSNPLEQLGLYMKDDEEEDEGEPTGVPNRINDAEEGEID
ncbi:Bromodomain and extraterminal domain protein 10, putative isoform 5 [Hibiscus syriacus]|uniref:Bromodomain and extraterminal domain protein 10, putative isoform 5 n=1 Tax=Hibiscus syriacus TaxID=106335 RepID=A0A6A3ANT9_HIBSY|nr:Bromodomain and extraterminal domain protein 10, putative isoform 5 [Hibiscus syriacus]